MPIDYGLQGRVALVTGAASGIGRPTTHEYSDGEWDRIVEINLRGTTLRQARPRPAPPR